MCKERVMSQRKVSCYKHYYYPKKMVVEFDSTLSAYVYHVQGWVEENPDLNNFDTSQIFRPKITSLLNAWAFKRINRYICSTFFPRVSLMILKLYYEQLMKYLL